MNTNGKVKGNTVAIVSVIGAFVLVAFILMRGTPLTTGSTTGTVQTDGGQAVATAEVGQCNQNPAYTYSAKDLYSTATFSGTDEIKVNGLKPVTSLQNPPFGAPLEYWHNGSTFFCNKVAVDKVKCGAQQVQTTCWQNTTTVSVATRDLSNDVTLSDNSVNGATNITMGANAVANLELRYQSNGKKAGLPLGGCLAVEVPSGVSDVQVTGNGITAGCSYPWTYTVSATSNSYKLFTIPSTFDSDGKGMLMRTGLQLSSGATNPLGVAYVTYQPANYYITNDGAIVLGIEKDKNQDTTKTFDGGVKHAFGIN